MLELSSPPGAQTGLTVRDLLVGCVAGNDPRSLGQALRLVQSIRWFGGELANARVVVCVAGGLDPSFLQAFEGYGAEVRTLSSADEGLLLLDCGTVVVQDPLPWLRRGSFQASPLPVELDFQLELDHLPAPEGYFAVDPAILRYHDRVDPEGYLLHTRYPFAQVRIEAFNRRLRQEREGGRGGSRPLPERPAMSADSADSASLGAQVVVLGMHRSGTSALTGLLPLLGLWAGEEEDFPPADDHNQAGYWEHRGVWSVDEAILHTLGASWSEVVDLDLSRLGAGLRARFRKRAREIVKDLDRHGSWVVKDPRLCLLFPFWREILERPLCVLIYREPLPVARSLAARDGFPIPFGIALWEKYTLEALASTRGLPRILISHRELMAEPAATLHRLHRHLVRHGPELARFRVPGEDEIRAVLDPALVHHPYDPEAERPYLTPPQLDLLDALGSGTALDLDPVPPLSPGARELLAAWQGLMANARGLRSRLAARAHEAASLRQAQEELRIAHEITQAALASGAADLELAHSRLDELDAIFSATLESRSWKVGRAVTLLMGRLLGRPRASAAERRDRLMAEVRRSRTLPPE